MFIRDSYLIHTQTNSKIYDFYDLYARNVQIADFVAKNTNIYDFDAENEWGGGRPAQHGARGVKCVNCHGERETK